MIISVAFLLIGSMLLSQQILTNDDILKAVKAGLAEDVIIGMIQQNPGKYTATPDGLIELKTAGVPDRVVTAMLKKAGTSVEPPSIVNARGEPLLLTDGTPVRLKLNRNLSSADAKVGESVDFEVLEELKVEDFIVVSRGATAIATVTEAQPKRRMGRGGKLNVNIDFVRLSNGEKVALRAIKDTKGGGRTGAMTGAMVATGIVFFPAAPLFLFMHGKDITIPKGTEITAYVSADIRLDRAKFKSDQ
jgi:hypothetical protein